jgi:glycosyltransferase involved in cell wall biosynthesis
LGEDKEMSQERPPVTVVVPTFNRAHILPHTLPCYAQPEVAEIIVIDDGSTDNTPELLLEMCAEYPILSYQRLEKNSGQAAAKNAGILCCRTPFVFFGDDDSVLLEGSIAALLACMGAHGETVAGARAIYMLAGESVSEAMRRTHRGRQDIVRIQWIRTFFDDDPGRTVEVPFCQACCMLPTRLARAVLFDPSFSGSGFREETDFQLRCAQAGARIFFCPTAVSLNLPREDLTGGAWARSPWSYERSTLANNWRFLNRHHHYLSTRWGLRNPKWLLQASFTIERLSFRARQFAKSLLGERIVLAWRKARARLRGSGGGMRGRAA